jgi:hypothetical protein
MNHQIFKDKGGLHVRKHKEFSQCDRCADLNAQLLLIETKEGREQIKAERREHFKFQQAQREKYYKHRANAMKDPAKCMSIIADGMDQAKLHLPSYVQNTKGNASFLDSTLQGLTVHGWGHFFFICGNNYNTGANHAIECLLQILQQLSELYEEKKMKWPDTLYLQLNGGSENKNRYTLAICHLLLSAGLFKKTKLGFLYVGHTHEDIAQSFSVVSRDLHRKDCLSVQELTARIKILFKRDSMVPSVKYLHAVWDYKTWLTGGQELRSHHKNIDSKLGGFRNRHVFRFTWAHGQIGMHVQEWATGKKTEWEPSTGMKGMQVVQPNLEHYPGLEAPDPKVDGPSTPEPFNKDWNKLVMTKLLTNLRSTAAKARAKWNRPDQNALQEWVQFMDEQCYDEQAALDWLGTFQWPQRPNTGEGLGDDSRREERGRVGPLPPVTHSTESVDERNTR